MSERKQRRPASLIFSHLSEEERIDKACELLAIGVLRLAAKLVIAGSVGAKQSPRSLRRFASRDDDVASLHQNGSLSERILKSEAVL